MDQWAGVVLAAETWRTDEGPDAHKVAATRSVARRCLRYPVELLRQLGIDRILVAVSPGNSQAVPGPAGR